ncbi:hypothetical protein KJ359_000140 [Pestalotiopsis sp. 9143b]|nr:hypothetical protein KJ359_000140 [Pestalotiopsis sp. 9143b]
MLQQEIEMLQQQKKEFMAQLDRMVKETEARCQAQCEAVAQKYMQKGMMQGEKISPSSDFEKELKSLRDRLEEANEFILKQEVHLQVERGEVIHDAATKEFSEIIAAFEEWVYTFVWSEEVNADPSAVSRRARDPAHKDSIEAFRALCEEFPEYRQLARYPECEETALSGLLLRKLDSSVFDMALSGVSQPVMSMLWDITDSLEKNAYPTMSEYEVAKWTTLGCHGIRQHPQFVKAREERTEEILKEVILPMRVFINPAQLSSATDWLRRSVVSPGMDLMARMSCTPHQDWDIDWDDYIEGQENKDDKDYVRQWNTTPLRFWKELEQLELLNTDGRELKIETLVHEPTAAVLKGLVKHCVLSPYFETRDRDGYGEVESERPTRTLVKQKVAVSWGNVPQIRKSSVLDEVYDLAKP